MNTASLMDEHILFSFEKSCEKHPDQVALIYLGTPYSYRHLQELSDRFAAALHAMGVEEEDRVFIYLQNCVQWVIAYLGVLRIGAIAVPVSPIYTPNEIRYLIKDSGAETMVCQDTNFGYVQEVFSETGLKRVIHTNLASMLPLWKRVVGTLFDRIPKGRVEAGDNVYSFTRLLREHPPNPPAKKTVNPHKDLVHILYTGGTTGLPKGVPETHGFLNCMIHDYHELTRGFVGEGEAPLLIASPLFHIMGLMTFMSLGLGLGNPTVLMPTPEIDSILRAIEKHHVALMIGVPAFYRMILENDRLGIYDLSSLRYCWCGGDVLPTEILRRWEDRFNISIYQNFGATETGFIAFSPLDKKPSANVIGYPVSTKEIKIVDPETLGPLEETKPGELLITSPYMVREYWNKPEETASAFQEMDGRLYYRVRDIVQIGEDRQLSYVDRGADIIKYKGYRVSCSEIEAVLQDHEAVTAACVIGVPDIRTGERIKAMVVLKESSRGVGSTDLIRWVRERLAPYKVPHYIEFRDMLPKSKVGKLLRREVRDEERRKMKKSKTAD